LIATGVRYTFKNCSFQEDYYFFILSNLSKGYMNLIRCFNI
jgi:hypothetical protein